MGETLLLQGQRLVPKKLQDAGFEFQYPNLEGALKHVLD
jgi:NAD dependent epimerase/dehydratase family enzyme